MATLISSQRYLNESIVAEKMATSDFSVTVSPEFELDGAVYRVVLDGHHSLSASKDAGVPADYTTADATDHDAVSLLNAGQVDEFLQVVHMGSDYYDITTGVDIW